MHAFRASTRLCPITTDSSTYKNILPGLESLNETEFFGDVTYPRFLFSSPDPTNSSFILELRIGRSGLGDDWLYEYNAENQSWTMIGKYLEVFSYRFRVFDG